MNIEKEKEVAIDPRGGAYLFTAASAPLGWAPSVRLQFNRVTQMHHPYVHLSVTEARLSAACQQREGGGSLWSEATRPDDSKVIKRATAEAARRDNDFSRSVNG